MLTHGRGSEGETGEWNGLYSTLYTTSEHGVSSITTADAANLACQQSTKLTPLQI
jgi:hypothetical protein